MRVRGGQEEKNETKDWGPIEPKGRGTEGHRSHENRGSHAEDHARKRGEGTKG